MKQKALTLKYIFVAAIVAVLAALSCLAVFGTYAAKAEDGTPTLVITDNVVTGVEGDGEEDFDITIPSTVVKIADYAFVGKSHLKSVTFARDGALREIGSFAFAGTGITALVLPEGLTTVGTAAFADCANLIGVSLPSSLRTIEKRAFGNSSIDSVTFPETVDPELTVGEGAFENSVNLVAYDIGQCESLKDKFGDIELTYRIKIKYNYLGATIGEEVRLFGKTYDYRLVGGIWQESAIDLGSILGSAFTDKPVYKDAQGNAVADKAYVNGLLSDGSIGDEITLYILDDLGTVFIARDDIVYDGTSYGMKELNPLLASASDRIKPDMTVSIKAYTDPDGNEATDAATLAAMTVCNAGVYTMNVADVNGANYEFTVNIARKPVDICAYDNLFWNIVKVGDSTYDNVELMNSEGLTLYLYETADGTVIPAYSRLDNTEAAEYGVDANSFTTAFVRYSVARNYGEDVVIELKSNAAYTVEYDGDSNIGNAIGTYTATAKLTADMNYTLTMSAVRPTDGASRGINVEVAESGRSANVSKVWYIVDISNWAVGTAGDAEYQIDNRVFGERPAFTVPRLMYGDVMPTQYGSSADKVSLSLYLGNTQIGETFTRDRFSYYLNSAMPAGNYRLTVRAEATVSYEYAEDDLDMLNPIAVEHNGFTRAYGFTVDKAMFDADALKAIDDVLQGVQYSYMWEENTSHLYDDAAAENINGILRDRFAYPSRTDTVWAGSDYAGYYGSFEIKFNLVRMQSDLYYTASELQSTGDPDKYTVYYCVTAPNYYSSVENLSVDDRTKHYFEVVNVREVALPVIIGKSYNGEVQVADVFDNDIYTVVNNGGSAAAVYDVVLTFVRPEYYLWEGQTLDQRTASITLKFAVTQAQNDWTVIPSVQNWIVGDYSAKDNAVVGKALFGNVKIVITDSNDKVVYDSVKGINKLKSADAGVYKLTATVDATSDYTGISHAVFIHIYDKEGLPWWAVLLIVLGVLAVVALVIFILWKKGVFQILTGKLVLAIRTKATVDATIAAVRANKIAEESKTSVAKAKAKEKAAERREAAKAERNKPIEEKAAALENKAKLAAERAERMRVRAEAMQARAEAMKERAASANAASEPETRSEPTAEAAATDNTEPTSEN